jgi:tetratricopeptide (TPR) repeat protein
MNKNYVKPDAPPAPQQNMGSPLLQSHSRLREAERLRQAKALDKSQTICVDLLKAHPDYVGALQTLGLVLADRRDYEGARLNLSRAAMLNPRDWKILTALAGVYLKLDAREMAMRTLEQARGFKPNDANILATLAEIYREEREYELAAAAYEQAQALDPSLRAMRIGLGSSLIHLGRFDEAAQAFISLFREDAQDLAALAALAQMPSGFAGIDVLKSLGEVRARPGQTHEEFEITRAFARSAALDGAKLHSEAWNELVTVNARIFAPLAETLHKEERSRAKHLELLNDFRPRAAIFETKRAQRQSLFILGPSRSGKTTMERLAAFLPGVRRGYENPIVENAIRHTFQGAGLITRSQLVELPSQLDEVFCQNYLAELDERAHGAQVFTNTHPARIIDAWRFALAVPGARFILIKRDAHDLALRIFMKRYRSGHPYSYDLKSIFRYIEWYHAMMDGLAGKFPELVRIIVYEKMIANPRHALATVADLCGLTVPDIALPAMGDDRGAALPYREAMEKVLSPG